MPFGFQNTILLFLISSHLNKIFSYLKNHYTVIKLNIFLLFRLALRHHATKMLCSGPVHLNYYFLNLVLKYISLYIQNNITKTYPTVQNLL